MKKFIGVNTMINIMSKVTVKNHAKNMPFGRGLMEHEGQDILVWLCCLRGHKRASSYSPQV